ncbi:MAG: PHP domain-containing protein [Victivallaceae bacterium]
MNAIFDFHLHSLWSYDADAPVEAYFAGAARRGMRAIALTEHFTMDSLPEIREAAARYPEVGYLGAAEMTVDTSIGAVDLVALGLPLETPPGLEAVFAAYREWQRLAGARFSEGMAKLGLDYPERARLELLRRYRPERAIAKHGVTHVNGLLQNRAFHQCGWLGAPEDGSALTAAMKDLVEFPRYPAAAGVLPVLKKFGALIFVAHPIYYFGYNRIDRIDALREELGFDGIECAHPRTPPGLGEVYEQYCRRHGLLASAGSDCHSFGGESPLPGAEKDLFGRHGGKAAWLEAIIGQLPLHHGEMDFHQ